jgi:hypothetical protein
MSIALEVHSHLVTPLYFGRAVCRHNGANTVHGRILAILYDGRQLEGHIYPVFREWPA